MSIISQPDSDRLGDRLKNQLAHGGFELFFLVSAYVRSSGVERIRRKVTEFRANGGKHVQAIVGIGQRNTSIQGLQGLLTLCDTDGAWVFHNESPDSTFHPKMYVLEKPNVKACVFIGSNNLTKGGLFTNYELALQENYDLTNRKHISKFHRVKKLIKSYMTDPDFSRQLTQKLIEEITEDYLSDEKKQRFGKGAKSTKGGKVTKKIFGFRKYGAPPLPGSAGTPPDTTDPDANIPKTPYLMDWPSKGRLRWSKPLTPGDCQLVGGNTSALCRMNLTQAGWKEGSKLIDQTKYFRFNLFRSCKWVKAGGTLETAKVRFRVKLKGISIGTFVLTLRYDPKWESKQGNRTTGLSWGELTKLIKDRTLVGKPVSIYDPPSGQTGPFFLRIG